MDNNEAKNKLRETVAQSTLSEASKQRALGLIADNTKSFSEVKEEILTLISDDIELDFQALGDDHVIDDTKEVEDAKQELDTEIDNIKDDLENDVDLVNATLDKLAHGAEAWQADAVSKSLAQKE